MNNPQISLNKAAMGDILPAVKTIDVEIMAPATTPNRPAYRARWYAIEFAMSKGNVVPGSLCE
jgi:hypothetical protein